MSKNDITIVNEEISIMAFKDKKGQIFKIKVDTCKIDLINQYKWHTQFFEKRNLVKVKATIPGSNSYEKIYLEKLLLGGKFKINQKLKFINDDSNDYRSNNLYQGNLYHDNKDGTTIIYLNNNLSTIVDTFNVGKLNDYSWYTNIGGYAVTKMDYREVFLHRFLMLKDYLTYNYFDVIDHINHNKLDNRLLNLRIVDNSINGLNSKIPINNTSGHVGVVWDKRGQKWVSTIKVQWKQYHLGRYDKKEDAIKARQDAEINFYGSVIDRG